jgi:uncharacterized alkaline shock family protein YloU
VEVAHANGHASVSLGLAVRYGVVASELARGVQERVAEALSESCELEVERVEVGVEEIV